MSTIQSVPLYSEERNTYQLVFEMDKAQKVGQQYNFYGALEAFDQHKVRLHKAQIPYSFYNVNARYGNTIFLNFQDIGPQTLTLQDGYYLIDDVTKAIKDFCGSLGKIDVTLTRTPLTYKLQLNSPTTAISISSPSIVTTRLGFQQSSEFLNTNYAVDINDLLPIKQVIVLCSIVEYNILNKNSVNMVGTVAVKANFGEIINAEEDFGQFFSTTNPNISSVSFQFQDSDLQDIDFNGVLPIVELIVQD